VKSTNNDAPKVRFFLCYAGGSVAVRDGNDDKGCCRAYKTVNPHYLTL
jgi:hypothetical protein